MQASGVISAKNALVAKSFRVMTQYSLFGKETRRAPAHATGARLIEELSSESGLAELVAAETTSCAAAGPAKDADYDRRNWIAYSCQYQWR